MAPTPTSCTTTPSTTSHSHCPPIDNSHGERGDRRWPLACIMGIRIDVDVHNDDSVNYGPQPILVLGGLWRHTTPPLPAVIASFQTGYTGARRRGGYWLVCIPVHAVLQNVNDEDQVDRGDGPDTALRIGTSEADDVVTSRQPRPRRRNCGIGWDTPLARSTSTSTTPTMAHRRPPHRAAPLPDSAPRSQRAVGSAAASVHPPFRSRPMNPDPLFEPRRPSRLFPAHITNEHRDHRWLLEVNLLQPHESEIIIIFAIKYQSNPIINTFQIATMYPVG
ncbi:hypothetical protein R3P38DRAFT_3218611 [Favolaschia claudopus]|uniref:Uncharacterized protein n=1 Tax=Favolaschia claudopus TaxID=2862362 RepID=A0AAW0A4N5_9AGAR